MSSPRNIALLGVGRMGRAMATRLTGEGWSVTTWTRSGRTVDGVPAADQLSDAVAAADVVVLALYDGPACRDVLRECRAALPEGVLVVNTSTIAPAEAAELEHLVTEAGARYVHAPVVGSVPAVAAGSLNVLAGGAPQAVADATELLGAFGSVLEAGDSRSAAAAKLVANGVLASAVRTIGAGLSWAEELGLDRELALDVLQRTPVGALVGGKRPRLEERRYGDADFALEALAKDLGLLTVAGASAEQVRRAVAGQLSAQQSLADSDLIALADVPSPSFEDGLSVAAGVPLVPEVLEPLVAYVRGHATGDPSHFARAFRPTAHIEGMREGVFTSWTVEEYQEHFPGKPAPDEPRRRRRIDSLEMSGAVATATMTLWHGESTFVDAFVLLRDGEEWRIANKVYERVGG